MSFSNESYKRESLYGERKSTRLRICKQESKCRTDSLKSVAIKSSKFTFHSKTVFYITLVFIIIAMICLALFYFIKRPNEGLKTKEIITSLRVQFPSQENTTWNKFLSVLDKNRQTVNSIILLHGQDKQVPDCLKKQLVLLYTGNDINIKDVTFGFDSEVTDYGQVLRESINIVKKHNILVVENIDQIPGNIARIFHTLCDEYSFPVKPSLYIFTLQYKKNHKNLKPEYKTTARLREVWNDLPDSDLHPLLSRIVKTAVDLLPENNLYC